MDEDVRRPDARGGGSTVSRRRLLYGGAGLGGLVVGSGAGAVIGDRSAPAQPSPVATGNQQLAFYGARQPGIAAPAQAFARVAALDLLPGTGRADVVALMRVWTRIAAAAMAGRPLPGGDDAMALGQGPASLTVTVGFGASMLRKAGLAARVPAALAPLPAFLGDELDPDLGDGDLGLFIAANDPLVAVHALRGMQRAAARVARVRWQLNGFGDNPAVLPSPSATGRNLMGQLDGTNNPRPGTEAFDKAVFAASDAQPAWMRGGSYLVVRRIRMLLDAWDTLGRGAQEAVIGRRKDTGAPLSGGTETTTPDYTKQNADGGLAIPAGAHIRQANPGANGGAAILRRGFSYHEGVRPDGSPDAGLIFLAFQADPRTGFIPIQRRLAGADSLSSFIRHETSALFAVPPGCAPGGYLGQALLEDA